MWNLNRQSISLFRRLGVTLIVMIVLGGIGCASTKDAPEYLTLSSQQYDAVFEAATETARDWGMAPMKRNRRSGVIETAPADVSSLLEPWKGDHLTISQAVESTLAHHRRRARFEFLPAGYVAPALSDEEVLSGPSYWETDQSDIDLTTFEGDLELRVWVYLERVYTPGLRRSTWSGSLTTQSRIIPPGAESKPIPTYYWTPTSRDALLERHLLKIIQQTIQDNSATG